MATLQEIQAQILKLRKIEENKREIEKLSLERREAEKELKRLQSPKLTKFKGKLFRANIKLGTALISGGKATAKFLNKAAQSIAEAERQQDLNNRRRIRTIKKKKTKTPTRRKTRKRR